MHAPCALAWRWRRQRARAQTRARRCVGGPLGTATRPRRALLSLCLHSSQRDRIRAGGGVGASAGAACALLACAACALLQALRGSARRQLRLREGPAEHSRALRSEREPGTAQHTVQEPGTVNRCPPARAKYRARVRRGRELDEEFRARMLALKKRGQAFGGRVIEQPTFAALDLGTTLLEPCSEESEEVKWSFCGSWSSAAWSSAGSEGSSRSCHCALASCAARQNEGAVATSL